tara:strand:+ start:1980 stop:2729 length:750 start_codon:yes stop_codon:yes gene_type:complete
MAYKKKLFDPQSTEPFALSRSRVDFYIKCPRCFYLSERLGIPQPDIIPGFTLNSAVDNLLKNEFDIYRKDQKPHPYFKDWEIDDLYPFDHEHMDTWRNAFKGMRYLHPETNFDLFGGIDDAWTDGKELYMVDYKSTSTKDTGKIKFLSMPWHDSWKRQLDFYAYLFSKNGFTVAKDGFFLLCNGQKNEDSFNENLKFKVELIRYPINLKWIDGTLNRIKQTLSDNNPPNYSLYCEVCRWTKDQKKFNKV